MLRGLRIQRLAHSALGSLVAGVLPIPGVPLGSRLLDRAAVADVLPDHGG